MTTTTDPALPRTRDALIQDAQGWDEWQRALVPLDASYAFENAIPDCFGVFIEHVVDDDGSTVHLHVPSLGSTDGYDIGDEAKWDQRIRDAVRAAAIALDLIPQLSIVRH